MEPLVKSNGIVRPCCTPVNCLVSQRAKDQCVDGLRGDIVVRVCRDCGARHIEMTVDPGRAFARGAEL